MRRILHDFEERLCEADEDENIQDNFNRLICLLDSPLFMQLVSIDEALCALHEVSQKQYTDENDFDIDVKSGDLKLLNKQQMTSNGNNQQLVNSGTDLQNYHNGNESVTYTEGIYLTIASLNNPEKHTGSNTEVVVLDKPDGPGIGLGFGIVGLRNDSQELGVFIQDIKPGGIAHRYFIASDLTVFIFQFVIFCLT